MSDRYTMPPFDPTGEHGPTGLHQTTEATQHRYLNGPERADLPGYIVVPGGVWYASGDGCEWLRVEREDEPR